MRKQILQHDYIYIKASMETDTDFLAYFQKMNVGLSNHQSVSPTVITFEPLGSFS
jgi:hypothetical protein